QAVEIHENPVFMAKVIDTGSKQVGYLALNAFRANYHQALNDSVGTLLSQGIDELILDLRYNGGGAIVTCSVLASMISGNDSTDVFAKFTYSEKRSALNSEYSFFSKLPVDDQAGGDIAMNTLSLNRLYVLTGWGTASASEMVINGLKPYIEVIQVGEQTVGKDVGSITVYDSPPYYNNKENLNPNHKIAMQPIVVKLVNADGQDYPNGFTPERANVVIEGDYLDENLPPMGDPSDPLLARALQLITGEPVAKLQSVSSSKGELFKDSRDLKPFGKDMYLLPERFEEINF
ncbi:MAG TPA: S41 family peptidase, partial [Balneolaceae bacterium]|nr:S41 family peptidase [Balneolaceae bacterium]